MRGLEAHLKIKRQVQKHHVSYKPEITVHIFKSEHMILTWLNMSKMCSAAFLFQLWNYVRIQEGHALSYGDMDDLYNHQQSRKKRKRRYSKRNK